MHDFLVPRSNGRLAIVGGMGTNLVKFLECRWQERLEDDRSGIFIDAFPRQIIKKMRDLADSDIYGSERCRRELGELYKQSERIASPYVLGGGGFIDLDRLIEHGSD